MAAKSVRATLLKRYTDLPAALALLRNRQLTLLSPATWEDKNDRVFMEHYANKKGLKALLGLCFSQAAETFHHWKVFAPGSAGVCIEFHKSQVLAFVPKTGGYRHRRVTYKRPVSLLASYATTRELPFIKGWAFRDEKEYRVIFESEMDLALTRAIPIDLSSVRSLVLSPWLPSALVEATKTAINEIPGCENLPVVRSSVIDNEHWQAYARDA